MKSHWHPMLSRIAEELQTADCTNSAGLSSEPQSPSLHGLT